MYLIVDNAEWGHLLDDDSLRWRH